MTAPTHPPPPLNRLLQQLSAAALADLAALWRLPPDQLAAALADLLPGALDEWALASAAVAADWYDELRDTQHIRGRFEAIVEPLADLGAEALAGWAAESLLKPQPDVVEARYRVEGGMQKRLVNAANHTVTHSAAQDPQARGYMRRTRPGACKFCLMVASRGAVYTKASSRFACHEHCFCESVPAWAGRGRPVDPYKPSDHPSTPEDRARVRQWIADNL
jgi:hypothetical protein